MSDGYSSAFKVRGVEIEGEIARMNLFLDGKVWRRLENAGEMNAYCSVRSRQSWRGRLEKGRGGFCVNGVYTAQLMLQASP